MNVARRCCDLSMGRAYSTVLGWVEYAADFVGGTAQVVVSSLWRNSSGQLSLLKHAIAAPPEIFTFEHARRKLAPLEGLHGGKSAIGLPNQAWLCLDLYDVLSRMTEAGHHSAVHQLLDSPIKNCPEVRHPFPVKDRESSGISCVRDVQHASLKSFMSQSMYIINE
jgi:hypothetical protein